MEMEDMEQELKSCKRPRSQPISQQQKRERTTKITSPKGNIYHYQNLPLSMQNSTIKTKKFHRITFSSQNLPPNTIVKIVTNKSGHKNWTKLSQNENYTESTNESNEDAKIKRFTTAQIERKGYEPAIKFNHPNTVKVYDVFYQNERTQQQNKNRLFIIMEEIKGSTLNIYSLQNPDEFNNEKYLKYWSFDKILDCYRQLFEVIRYFIDYNREEGKKFGSFIHRDLKMENIMINEQGIIKIIDFGHSKIDENGFVSIQSTYHVCPSQYLSNFGKKIAIDYTKVDIWQAGCLLYHMIFLVNPIKPGIKDCPAYIEATQILQKDWRNPELNSALLKQYSFNTYDNCYKKAIAPKFMEDILDLTFTSAQKRNLQEIERIIYDPNIKQKLEQFYAQFYKQEEIKLAAFYQFHKAVSLFYRLAIQHFNSNQSNQTFSKLIIYSFVLSILRRIVDVGCPESIYRKDIVSKKSIPHFGIMEFDKKYQYPVKKIIQSYISTISQSNVLEGTATVEFEKNLSRQHRKIFQAIKLYIKDIIESQKINIPLHKDIKQIIKKLNTKFITDKIKVLQKKLQISQPNLRESLINAIESLDALIFFRYINNITGKSTQKDTHSIIESILRNEIKIPQHFIKLLISDSNISMMVDEKQGINNFNMDIEE